MNFFILNKKNTIWRLFNVYFVHLLFSLPLLFFLNICYYNAVIMCGVFVGPLYCTTCVMTQTHAWIWIAHNTLVSFHFHKCFTSLKHQNRILLQSTNSSFNLYFNYKLNRCQIFFFTLYFLRKWALCNYVESRNWVHTAHNITFNIHRFLQKLQG